MRDIFHFFRFASNNELIDIFGTCDFDEIFDKYTEVYIINKITEYLLEE